MNKEKNEEREEYLAKYGVDSLDTGYSCYEEKENLKCRGTGVRMVEVC